MKRLVLPYVTMALVLFYFESWSLETFLKNVSGYNFFFKSIYSYLWFVPAISIFYLVFPLFFRGLSHSKKPLLFILGTMEIWLLLSVFLSQRMREDLYGFTNRIPVFLVGILIGFCLQNGKEELLERANAFLWITFALGAYLAYKTNYRDYYLLVPVSNCCLPNLLLAISMTMLLSNFLDKINQQQKIARFGGILQNVLNFYGKMSLEIYCIQSWGGQRIIQFLTKYQGIPNFLIWAIEVAILTAIGFSSHWLFDKIWNSIESMGKKWIRRTR